MKSQLCRFGTTLKYSTAKELSKGRLSLPSNTEVLEKFLEGGKKRRLNNCEIFKYQIDYVSDQLESISMYKLLFGKIILTDIDINNIEKEARDHYESSLWNELRYGRVTTSPAFQFSRGDTTDGSLIVVIMVGKFQTHRHETW